VCALQIRAERAEELKFAVERWGPDNVALLSLTVRTRARRRSARGATRRRRQLSPIINGKPWERFCEKYGLQHHVRSIEVTHGGHGWHPHLHVLFFLEVKLTEDEQAEAAAWLQQRWERCVRRALGADFVPNEHGVDLRESKRADYLAKFSLELTDPGTKRARGKNRTPLQIAAAAATGRRQADETLWVTYCSGMRGAKMLTWSRGLREAVDLDLEEADEEIVASEEQQPAEQVAIITAGAWDAVRYRRGMACAILEAAELAGRGEAAETIQSLIWNGAAPRVPP